MSAGNQPRPHNRSDVGPGEVCTRPSCLLLAPTASQHVWPAGHITPQLDSCRGRPITLPLLCLLQVSLAAGAPLLAAAAHTNAAAMHDKQQPKETRRSPAQQHHCIAPLCLAYARGIGSARMPCREEARLPSRVCVCVGGGGTDDGVGGQAGQ